jgi:NAD(P)-dependent dehydrogenase (short-subunit alcohol dehydrogenase family)
MASLARRRILVVGGASGIGLATARACAEAGARVVIADRHPERGRQAAEEVGADAFHAADVTDEQSVRALFGALGEDWEALDGLVNTAGILRVGGVAGFSTQDWDDLFVVNARGQFLVLKHALPLLEGGESPAVVTLGSAAGIKGGADTTGYAATKGAVIAFSRAAAMELAPLGIRVNALCPGWVDTDFNQVAYDAMGGADTVREFVESSVPLARQARPEEIGAYAAFLLSPDAGYVTGHAVVADGGML